MKLPSTNNLFLIAGGVVILGAIYWFFFASNGASSLPLTLTASSTQSEAEAQFQTLTGQLSSITFNTTVFSDPRFAALVDISVPVTPEPVGRTDIFAPPAGFSSSD